MSETLIAISTIETERLILRAPRPSDVDAYAAFYASAQAETLGGRLDRSAAWSKLASMIGHWRLRGFGRWVIERRADGLYCGHIGPHFPEGWPEPEIAWSVVADVEGQGVAFEAASAARAYAYDALGWSTAISLCEPDNARSIRLAERLGAAYEGDWTAPEGWTARVYRHPSAADLRERAA